MSAPSVLFDEQFLRRLEHFRLVSRQKAHGHLRGIHRSRRVGSGMVFTDYRPYTPGDDIKRLDWGSYLRLDRLMLRLFEEETDQPTYVFLDASASMGFGEPDKFDYARRVAAALSYVGLVNMDRVSVVAFAEGLMRHLPARRGKVQLWSLLRFLSGISTGGRTAIAAALRAFFSAPKTRGVVILVSDFLDPQGLDEAFQILRRFRHEVFAVHVVSPQELSPVLPEEVVLTDAEDGSGNTVRVTPAILAAYREEFDKFARDLAARCRAGGWAYIRAETQEPIDDLILKSMRSQDLLR